MDIKIAVKINELYNNDTFWKKDVATLIRENVSKQLSDKMADYAKLWDVLDAEIKSNYFFKDSAIFKNWLGLLAETKYAKVKVAILKNKFVLDLESAEYKKTLSMLEMDTAPQDQIKNNISFDKKENIKVTAKDFNFSLIIDTALNKVKDEGYSLIRIHNMILYCVKNNAMDDNMQIINTMLHKLGEELNPVSAYTFFYQDSEVGYITLYVFEYDNLASPEIK